MPIGIDTTVFDRRKQSACDNFYKDVEIAQEFFSYYAEEHGIDNKKFERVWDRFIDELEQLVADGFTYDLDADEMGGGDHDTLPETEG